MKGTICLSFGWVSLIIATGILFMMVYEGFNLYYLLALPLFLGYTFLFFRLYKKLKRNN
jgi:hypothetical protein